MPENYIVIDGAIIKYNKEYNNFYFGNQAWAENGKIHIVDRASGDALFDGFLFDNERKNLRNLDPSSNDSFPEDFNRYYGGNQDLHIDKKAT